MIAQQPQGGLGQVSQPPQAKPAAMPQGKPKQIKPLMLIALPLNK